MKTKLYLWLWAALLLAPGASVVRAAPEVQVYGQARSSGPIVTVQVYADIAGTQLLSCGYRLMYDPAVYQLQGAAKNEEAWYFSDGKGRIPYLDPEIVMPGQVLVLEAKLDPQNPLAGISGKQVLLGTFEFQRLTPATSIFMLAIGRAAPFANFVTVNQSILDTRTGALIFGAITPDPNDTDLDGLMDDWERKYFGDIRNAYYTEDPDRDTRSNLAEQAAGTDPTVSNTTGFTLNITRTTSGIHVEWPALAGNHYDVEFCSDISGAWSPLATGLKATPPMNVFDYSLGEGSSTMFFRVVQRATP
jgi:hypothetical protein